MTEKNYNPEQKQAKTMKKQEIKMPMKPIKDYGGVSEPDLDKLKETEKELVKKEEKKEDKKTKQEDKKKTAPKIKKDEAVVNGISLPISTKTSADICRFIKHKPIAKAIADLEEVEKFKKVVPMKGEIPHKHGKGIMAGRYPIHAVGYFIKLLKNLQANANVNGIEEPIIAEAIANRASLPYGRFGSIRRKRTHIKIKVTEKKTAKKEAKK